MKTYEATVSFSVTRQYKIRAASPEEAGRELFRRVKRTEEANKFDVPIVILTSDSEILDHAGLEF